MIELSTKYLRERFAEAIWSLVGKMPDAEMVDAWLDNEDERLQTFCIHYLRCQWMTGMGVIEAAMVLVDGAMENGNIDSEGRVV